MVRFLFALFLCILFVPSAVTAQDNQYLSAAESDPEAVTLLEGIRKKYDAFSSMRAHFRLDIAFPGQPVESQAGQISRKGDNVRFKIGSQEGIINQQAAYIIQHGNKEVMINNLPDPTEMTGVLTPQTLFNFYQGDDYVLAMVGNETADGKTVRAIELKPLDRDASEFTKMRVLVDPAKKEIVNVKAFSRDGSSFTFHLDRTETNPALAANTFTFEKSDFPGYHVEDLRY